MTDTAALQRLIEAVEAGGNIQPFIFQDALNHSEHRACAGDAWEAYEGSLDAAKALHEVVVPKLRIGGLHDFGGRWSVRLIPGDHIANDADPARAWLLAILKVKLSEANG